MTMLIISKERSTPWRRGQDALKAERKQALRGTMKPVTGTVVNTPSRPSKKERTRFWTGGRSLGQWKAEHTQQVVNHSRRPRNGAAL